MKLYQEAYRIGQHARQNGITDMRDAMRIYWSQVEFYNHTAYTFMAAGLAGAKMPYIVTGWRYGHIPASGLSFNARDDRPESGVSVMAVDGGEEIQDRLSALFIAVGRPVVQVRGYLNTIARGSDGEPLLLDAGEIK
jgi:hypothetical protein